MDNVPSAFSSSNENPMHQNFNPSSQINHLVPEEQLNFSTSTPYFLPYAGRTQIPSRDTFLQGTDPFYSYPLRSFPMAGLRNYNVDYHGMGPTWESITESERKKKGTAIMTKIARNIRKEARQRTRSSSSTSRASSSSTLELQASKKVASRRIMEDKIVHNNEIPNTLHSLDGKRLKKLLTKTLKNSDVGFLGRIVLPKNEAEKNLPALSNKEGIEVILKDVCTNHQWRMRYKYWCNNKSRMYVLENTGNFVKHYQLQVGDSITLFEDDELKNLYVLPKKEQTAEVTQQLLPIMEEENHYYYYYYDSYSNIDNYIDMNMIPYKQEKYDEIEDEASLGKLIDQIVQESSSHNNNNKNLLTMCSSNVNVVGGSTNNNASQVVAPTASSSSSSSFQADVMDDFFEGIDMPQFGCM